MIYSNDEEVPEVDEEESGHVICVEADEEPLSLLGLCGEINEDSLQELSLGLVAANKNKILNIGPEDFEDVEDLELFISSNGGSVGDMFAIYDLMTVVKRNRDISTCGFGKVSSAAVLLLAAGTKGKRFISPNTRIMLHRCSATEHGPVPNLKTVLEEAKKVEEMMIQALAANSNLSVKEVYKIMSRNTDEYFSAEQTLEMGLADKII